MVDIVGTIGNNSLIGTAGNDKIEGLEGNDTIEGRGGNDELFGGEGNDTYRFNANVNNGLDRLEDDKGVNQIMIMNDAGATIAFSQSVTVPESVIMTITKVVGGQTRTTQVEIAKVLQDGVISAEATLTRIVNAQGSLLFDLAAIFAVPGTGPTAGNDILTGTEASETINGLAGNDEVSALGGNDLLNGGSGDDTLIGGAGVDEYRFGANFGADVILEQIETLAPFGGIITFAPGANVNAAGISVARSATAPTSLIVTVDNAAGVQQGTIEIVDFFASADPGADATGRVVTLVTSDGTQLNLVDLASEATESGVILGTAADEALAGTVFDDVIIGGQGDDTLSGDLGFDSYVFRAGDGQDSIVDVAPEPPQPFDPAQGGKIVLVNVDPATLRLARTEAFDGLIVTYGTFGADTIRISGAFTEPAVGLGVYSGTIAAIEFVTATDPNDPGTFVPVAGATVDLNAPVTFTGSALSDLLLGTDGNDVINAGSGNDVITVGTGVDTVDGGTGIDTLVLGNETGPVPATGETIDLNGVATASGRHTNIENVIGTRAGDTIIANAAANLIEGGAGIDTVSYAASNAGVTVGLGGAVEVNLGGFATGDLLEAIENLIGSAFDDALTGSAQANALTGANGNDSLSGLGGNDTLTGGAGSDMLLGGAGDDSLVGGSGSDVLNGGAGNDIITGGGGDGVDTAVFAGLSTAYGFARSGGQLVVTGLDGIDTLSGVEFLQFGDGTFAQGLFG